jgi:hypothetical protein
MAAVSYPAPWNIFGMVGISVGIKSGASPGRIFASAFLQGYMPVKSAYRLGVDVADVAYPLLNLIPFSARDMKKLLFRHKKSDFRDAEEKTDTGVKRDG